MRTESVSAALKASISQTGRFQVSCDWQHSLLFNWDAPQKSLRDSGRRAHADLDTIWYRLRSSGRVDAGAKGADQSHRTSSLGA